LILLTLQCYFVWILFDVYALLFVAIDV